MCKIKNCEYQKFFCGVDKDGYCDLHSKNKKDWDKEKRKEFEENFKKLIKYLALRNRVVFEDIEFIKINWSQILKDYKNLNIKFINCTFLENSRFDDIKCKSLVFEDCSFLDGGGIKNKNDENSLDIDYLKLGLYELEGDFVVDIGKYAKDDGTIELKEGRIKKLEFENPQKGSGRIFFIGLNKKLEKGIFVNRILDRVIFQNSNLTNCYFLNAKVDKTEFRNVVFPKFDNLGYFFIRENSKDGFIISFFVLLELFVFLIFISFKVTFNSEIDLIFICVLFLQIIIIFSMMDVSYTKILSLGKKFLDRKNDTFLNAHLGTKDEEKIIEKVKNTNSKENIENIRVLKVLYENLAINFLNTDKQIAGEFIYSSKFYKSLVFFGLWDFMETFPNKAHHFINGFGQRWFRAMCHFVFTLIIFAFVFTYLIKPNKDYIATKDTPSFLLKYVDSNDSHAPTTIYNQKSFSVSLWENNSSLKDKEGILYGFDNRYNFNGLKDQKIFALKEDLKTGFYKSFSNLLYPFNSFSKNWFENISEKAYFLSFFETILLWVFLIAFVKALWNRIKF